MSEAITKATDEQDELEADMADKAAVMPAAVVAEVYQSRYTIEWVNGPMPLGTNLYAGPKVVKAWAEEVPEDSVCDTSVTAPQQCAFKRGARAILAMRPAVEPMTPDHIWANDGIMSANGIIGFKFDAVIRIVRAVEAHHGITAKAEGGA